jgi:APA family basic amino acid/polyamine antiporter
VEHPAEPRGQLNLFDATMLVMGGVIGVGIFFTPQAVARQLPESGPFFAAWLLGGLIGLAGGMTFAELAATFPRAGGWFVYLREAFGPFPAFLFAWIVLLVISTGACAVVADFLAQQVEALAWGAGAGPTGSRTAIGLVVLVGLTLVCLLGVKVGSRLQDTAMVLKLVALATLVGAGLVFAAPAREAPLEILVPDAPPAPPLAEGLALGILPVLFAYGGWQLVTYIAPSVRDPQRTLPRALVLGSLGVIAVYLLVNAAYARVLGLDGLRAVPGFASVMAERCLGPVGGRFLVAAMALSALGVCAAILLATPALYVAMAREGLFFEAFGALHPRTGAPTLAVLVQGAVAVLYYLWGHAGLLTDAVVFAEWIFHALVGAGLLWLRVRRPDLPRPFRSWIFPLFPLLYTLLATGVVAGALVQAPGERTLLGLGVLGLGAVLYRPWRWLVAYGKIPRSA